MVLRVLVSGFGPFRGAAVNASSEAVRRVTLDGVRAYLPPQVGMDVEVVTVTDVPVVWNRGVSSPIVRTARELDARLVVAVGEAGAPGLSSSALLRVERFARNVARGADEHGVDPAGAALHPGEPPVLECNVPALALERALESARGAAPLATPSAAELATSAGAFLCNATFYELLREAPSGQTARWVSFVHVFASREPAEHARIALALTRLVAAYVEHARCGADGRA